MLQRNCDNTKSSKPENSNRIVPGDDILPSFSIKNPVLVSTAEIIVVSGGILFNSIIGIPI